MITETKMALPAGGVEIAREMAVAFEALKAANDARLDDIEKRGAADPLIEERLAKIDKTLDRQRTALERLALEQARPGFGDDPRKGDPEHKSAWGSYLRKGDDGGLARLDLKSLTQGTDAQGGYVAPPELDRLIEARLLQSSPMRQIASVRQTSATVFRKPVSLGAASAWTTETGTRTETTSPTLDLLEFPAAELYAMPAATQTLLDDAYLDIDAWLADEVETAFAVALCEGEIARVSRCWANGELLDLSKTNWRLYRGSETQAPDPLIEAIEGSGLAPAYRGLAYIVFEDLNVDAFGSRMPQLSFEVERPAARDAERLETVVKG